jgi:ABC-2 type transport system ATP-binding protein/ribosome-dependent ATPase
VTALASASGVWHRFGNTAAVAGVDLTVDAGEVVGLLGANGAGKTTLVRVLIGLLRPSAGDVRLFGTPPSPGTRRRIGYVPQGLGLYDDLTAAENLSFQRAVFGGGTGAATAMVRAVARLPVGSLPLGTQRHVAFAAALDHRPELLVLDEPTSGVGPLGAARLWDVIRGATEEGAGALVTTHDLEEAEQCDRLVVMSAGRVVASGTVDAVIGGATTSVVRTGDWVTAFDRLAASGMRPALVGDTLRVPDASPEAVHAALGELATRVETAPATLEERFVTLSATADAEPVPR